MSTVEGRLAQNRMIAETLKYGGWSPRDASNTISVSDGSNHFKLDIVVDGKGGFGIHTTPTLLDTIKGRTVRFVRVVAKNFKNR